MSAPVGRVLRKIIPGAVNVLQTETGLTQLSNGWEVIVQPYGGEIIVKQTEFDLAGYTREELTFYPGSVNIQQGQSDMHVTALLTGAGVRSWDIVTTQKMTNSQLSNFMSSQSVSNPPGFSDSPLSLTNVIYGRFRQWWQNSQITGFLPLSSSEGWGLLSETAAEKIWVTRIYQSLVGPLGTLNIPDVAFVIVGGTVKEPDFVHLEQLRRVYDLEG